MMKRRLVLLGLGVAALGIGGAVVPLRFASALRAQRARSSRGSRVFSSRFGQIEFATVGQGTPLLIVHGAGGGFDQGLAVARRLKEH